MDLTNTITSATFIICFMLGTCELHHQLRKWIKRYLKQLKKSNNRKGF